MGTQKETHHAQIHVLEELHPEGIQWWNQACKKQIELTRTVGCSGWRGCCWKDTGPACWLRNENKEGKGPQWFSIPLEEQKNLH